MNKFNKFITGSAAAVLAVTTALVFTLVGNASAACYHYDPNGTVTSSTPVFNNFCDAPYGIGSEADFVRIRQNANGDVKDNQNNPAYTNSVSSTCASGEKFDVWNYVHNDASPESNGNGSGSAVAHDVKLALSAPVDTADSTFIFGGKLTASNAAGIQDNATLNCNGQKVQLSLVPGSVHLYSKPYGWKDLGDGTVNSTIALGSPEFGSGNVWGCWDYRIVVVYQVTVKPAPKPVKATCDLFNITLGDNRRVKVSQFKYTNENATIQQVVLNWGDNNVDTIKDAQTVVGREHQYKANGTYVIAATITFLANGETITANGSQCAKQVTFASHKPPKVVPPPSSPPPSVTTTPPAQLVNTGPGSVAGLFAVATLVGAFIHRRVLSRRLG